MEDLSECFLFSFLFRSFRCPLVFLSSPVSLTCSEPLTPCSTLRARSGRTCLLNSGLPLSLFLLLFFALSSPLKGPLATPGRGASSVHSFLLVFPKLLRCSWPGLDPLLPFCLRFHPCPSQPTLSESGLAPVLQQRRPLHGGQTASSEAVRERGSWASRVCASLSARGTFVCPGTPALLCPIFVISPSERRIALAALFSWIAPALFVDETTYRLSPVRPPAPSVFTYSHAPSPQNKLYCCLSSVSCGLLCPFPILSFHPLSGKNISSHYLCPSSFSRIFVCCFLPQFPFPLSTFFRVCGGASGSHLRLLDFLFHCRPVQYFPFVHLPFSVAFSFTFVGISSSSPRTRHTPFPTSSTFFTNRRLPGTQN